MNVNHKHFRPQKNGTLETRGKIDFAGERRDWTISVERKKKIRVTGENMAKLFNNSICKQKLFVMLPSKIDERGKNEIATLINRLQSQPKQIHFVFYWQFSILSNLSLTIRLMLIQLIRLTLSCGAEKKTIEPKSFHPLPVFILLWLAMSWWWLENNLIEVEEESFRFERWIEDWGFLLACGGFFSTPSTSFLSNISKIPANIYR